MLNVDYKIVAKALATRLKRVLESIIDPHQTGFMSGRNILNNIRRAMEVLEYTSVMHTPAILASIDYEKCFDMLEHHAIWGAMRQYNFEEGIINMIQCLFNGFNSCIVSNGYVSQTFPISRSVHQGSPISSFLFLIAGQILTYLVKTNPKIKGINLNGTEYVISQFADDTDMFLEFNQETITQLVKTFETVQKNMGLHVNYDKTTLYRMGSIAKSNAKIYTARAFQWTNIPPNILGVNIMKYNDKDILNENFMPILDKTKCIINQWSNRNLSLSGKVLVVNTLVASLFVYKMSVLPNVSYDVILEFERIINLYLGNGKPCRISLDILKLPKQQGGLRLVDLFKRQLSLKAQWVVTITQSPEWADIAYVYLNTQLKEKIW